MNNLDYMKKLNDDQHEAVTYLDGPLLIVAGAGSGKTRVLTSKIAHIIDKKKAFPNQILSVTFTNKAAKEMQIRVSTLLKKKSDRIKMVRNFSFNKCKNIKKTRKSCWVKPQFYDFRSR